MIDENLIKNYIFTNGLIFNSETQVFIFNLNTHLLNLNDLSKDNTPESLRKLLRSYSKIDSYIFFERLKSFSKNKKLIIDEFLNFINSLGLGFLELIKFNGSSIIFIQKNIYLTNSYFNLFGENPKCFLEEELAGYLEHFLSLMYSKKVLINISKKNSYLIYECIVSDCDFNYVCKENYNNNKIFEKVETGWIRNLIFQKKIICKGGKFGVLGKYSIVLPAHYYFTMLSNYTKSQFDFLENIVASFVLNFISSFDLTDKKTCNKIYDIMFPHLELVGVGTINNINSDLKYFSCNSNLVSDFKKYYSNDLIKIFQTLSFLGLKGFYEFSFNKTTKLIFSEDFSKIELKEIADKKSNSEIIKKLEECINKNNDIVKL